MTLTHIGITATRNGLTTPQQDTLTRALAHISRNTRNSPVLHHGCCVGGDQWASHQAQRLGWSTHAHPAVGVDRWQTPDTGDDTWREEPLPPLTRNKAIVRAVTSLLACPSQDYARDAHGRPTARQSGTWTTVRYAATAGIVRAVILPDGSFLAAMDWSRPLPPSDPVVFTGLRPIDSILTGP